MRQLVSWRDRYATSTPASACFASAAGRAANSRTTFGRRSTNAYLFIAYFIAVLQCCVAVWTGRMAV